MESRPEYPFLALIAVSSAFLIYRRLTRSFLDAVPGPPCHSWVYGNVMDPLHTQSAESHFKRHSQYGPVVRLMGPLGHRQLLLSDPKALNHVFQTASYNYLKPPERIDLGSTIVGRYGVLVAEGDVHKRQRKILNPAFSPTAAHDLLPSFQMYATRMCTQLMSELLDQGNEAIVVNMTERLSRATLDAIGEAAFDYDFGSLEDKDNELARSFRNLVLDAVPNDSMLLMLTVLGYLPSRLRKAFARHAKLKTIKRALGHEKIALRVARELLRKKMELLRHGDGRNDVMSLILKANVLQKPGHQLSEDEVISQVQTMMFAGHDTSSNTLSWTLLELCKHPNIQAKLRAEINEHYLQVRHRKETEFTWQDLESMSYLQAVLKESLRFHPVVHSIPRQSWREDVIPLSQPIRLNSGELVSELTVPGGTSLTLSVAEYNRSEAIFGPDSRIFNPDRWLTNTITTKDGVGVFSNLMTFSTGTRSCIGWRFAVLEVQIFLVEIIRNFEVSLDIPHERIRREGAGIMTPTVEGQIEIGSQLPIRLRNAAPNQ